MDECGLFRSDDSELLAAASSTLARESRVDTPEGLLFPPAVHELGRLTIGDVSGGGPVAGAAFLARSNDRNDTLAALGFSSPYLPDLSLSPAATRPPKEAFFTSFFDSTLASELGGMGDGTIHAIDRDATAGDGDTAGIRDACIGSASPTCAGPGGFTW